MPSATNCTIRTSFGLSRDESTGIISDASGCPPFSGH
jgi:hypothetical protein